MRLIIINKTVDLLKYSVASVSATPPEHPAYAGSHHEQQEDDYRKQIKRCAI